MSLIISDEEFLAVAENTGDAPAGFWGELLLDLAGCDPDILQDQDAIKRWIVEVVDVIGMTRLGPVHVEQVSDGPLPGITGVQVITTSLVSVHTITPGSIAHINVFSCRPFDVSKATEFCVGFFNAAAHTARICLRRPPPVKVRSRR